MTNVDFTLIELEALATHYVGSKLREQEVKLSSEMSQVDENTHELFTSLFNSTD